jgi:RNA polymerase sigma-70 factor, ECF subfamily
MLGLSPGPAQEAVQEAFLRYFLARRKGDLIENPRAWVFRVTHNLCLKVRAKAARSYPLDDELATRLRSPEASIESNAIDRERMQQLHAAIGELSPQQKRCLFLRAEGLRYHEIAETVGISPSSVGEFLKRAIVRLRKAISEA